MAKKQPTDRPKGRTKLTQMRLEPHVLVVLDELVEAFTAETGNKQTRTSTVRMLIHREGVRRKGGKP